MKKKYHFLLLLFLSFSVNAQVIYVNANVQGGSNNGTS